MSVDECSKLPASSFSVRCKQMDASVYLIAFRTEAKRSIPWIIQAEPVECFRELFDNHVDEMWSDLGQADVADIPLLIACLKHNHPRASEYAALKLGELAQTVLFRPAEGEATAFLFASFNFPVSQLLAPLGRKTSPVIVVG